MARKSYSTAFKEEAVQRVASGEQITKVAKDMGVAYPTLRKWCNKHGLRTKDYLNYSGFITSGTLTDFGKLVLRHECHIVMTSDGWWECDRCGGPILWDGTDHNDPPSCKFCPNCGSKVVR